MFHTAGMGPECGVEQGDLHEKRNHHDKRVRSRQKLFLLSSCKGGL
jgi:hypothetical protein